MVPGGLGLDGTCAHPRIDHRPCTRCGLCVAVCVPGVLTLHEGRVRVVHPERCNACGACEEICPEGAIDCEFEIVWGEGQEPAAPPTEASRHPFGRGMRASRDSRDSHVDAGGSHPTTVPLPKGKAMEVTVSDYPIYLDNAAATRLDERVLEAMTPYYLHAYAVATSQFGYSLGIDARDALDEARAQVAATLGAKPEELIFTSGDTESSNMALKGVAMALGARKGRHVITSAIEDFPVLYSARTLEKQGFAVTILPVDGHGRVDPDDLRRALRRDTILVSIQAANQEIGTLQDIAAIGAICREHDVLFHTDATHAFPRVPLDVRRVPVDLVTISAHLIHGPRGIGGLYVRQGTPIAKWMDGGFQEFNLRAGVENIPGAVGFARAMELVTPEETAWLRGMRDHLLGELLRVPDARLNGHPEFRLPHNANVSFRYVEGESILLHLDMRGFAVSTGSACFSRSLEASHVILAIGGDHERAHGSVRFTFGRFNEEGDVDAVVGAITDVITSLRAISPLGKE
jgi:cysteine desulfurase